jgi:hypothetical protein
MYSLISWDLLCWVITVSRLTEPSIHHNINYYNLGIL